MSSHGPPPFLPDVFLHWLQILDRVADGLVFGALLPCEECSGQLVFKGDAYYCTGDVTAWTKCMVKTQTPNRKEWVTPKVSEVGGRSNPGIFLQKNSVCACLSTLEATTTAEYSVSDLFTLGPSS